MRNVSFYVARNCAMKRIVLIVGLSVAVVMAAELVTALGPLRPLPQQPRLRRPPSASPPPARAEDAPPGERAAGPDRGLRADAVVCQVARLRREALRGHWRPRGGQSTSRGPVHPGVERRTAAEGGGAGSGRGEIELAAAAVRAAEAAVATAQANVSAAEAGNIRADADVTRWQSQYARISQLVSGRLPGSQT